MKKKIRIIVDCGMVLLLPLLMAYSLVGETAHEYLGIGMFLLFIAHHILNIAWWKNLIRGKYTPIRIVGTVSNFVLVIIMLALPISGMILSRHAFRFWHFGGTSAARTVHLLASYWGLVLMSLHAGMHGNVMMGMIRKAANMQHPSKIRTWNLRVIPCCRGLGRQQDFSVEDTAFLGVIMGETVIIVVQFFTTLIGSSGDSRTTRPTADDF